MLRPQHVVMVRRVRKACEHCCFAGAGLDFIWGIAFREPFMVMAFGKLALVCGAAAVFMVHVEEAHIRAPGE